MYLFFLAQVPSPPAPSGGPSASDIFYLTLIGIFLTGIVTTLVTKWARDKCLKFFNKNHVAVERLRGQTIWGTLKVFSSGIEVVYDHAFPDHRGRKKTSFLIYQQELEQQVLSIFRYAGALNEQESRERQRQIHRTFNPGPIHRLQRSIRNLVNTLRDAFGAAIGAVVGQYQKVNPAGAVLASQGTQVTQMSQTLLGRFANAYEPLLEQYIGQPVILEVADPINPNHHNTEYTGYLADYTQQFIAVFSVAHEVVETHMVTLPHMEQGEPLPPLPLPPAPGTPRIELPPPLKVEHCMAMRIDGRKMLLQNTNYRPIVLRKFEREGFEPYAMGLTLAPNASVEMPAHQARGAKITFEVVKQIDIVAPRKYATVRHAGELVERRGWADELQLDQLPLVPMWLGNTKNSDETAEP
jgi:hypothetical protein